VGDEISRIGVSGEAKRVGDANFEEEEEKKEVYTQRPPSRPPLAKWDPWGP
jgi:hypothetical protein